MARYGMVIDVSRCIGCGGCVLACKAEHCLPPGVFWARVLMKDQGKFPSVTRTMLPVLCNHCRNAACVDVCPTGATSKREDGIVTIDYDKCLGCRYCMMACPYGSRYFYSKVQSYYKGNSLTPYEEMGYSRFQTGVVLKCTFCQEKIDEGLEKGLKPGIDREATPSCVNSCIGKCRFFGDLDDPNSEVSQLIRSRRGKQLRPDLDTEPSVYYLE